MYLIYSVNTYQMPTMNPICFSGLISKTSPLFSWILFSSRDTDTNEQMNDKLISRQQNYLEIKSAIQQIKDSSKGKR